MSKYSAPCCNSHTRTMLVFVIYLCIHIYTHTLTHIYVYIYIHTYVRVCQQLGRTGWRRLIGSHIFTGHFLQKKHILVALLWKMICNLVDPMSFRHPVIFFFCNEEGCVLQVFFASVYEYMHVHMCSRTLPRIYAYVCTYVHV